MEPTLPKYTLTECSLWAILDVQQSGPHLCLLIHRCLTPYVQAATAIARALRGDTYFQEVELVDAYIGDEGTIELCESLQVCYAPNNTTPAASR